MSYMVLGIREAQIDTATDMLRGSEEVKCMSKQITLVKFSALNINCAK